jgi:hypothetical protein
MRLLAMFNQEFNADPHRLTAMQDGSMAYDSGVGETGAGCSVCNDYARKKVYFSGFESLSNPVCLNRANSKMGGCGINR